MNHYETNLQALESQFPRILTLLEAAPADRYELVPARNGAVTIKKDGVFVHSRHDPEREAEKLINREISEETDFCLFYGFGLGYHIEAFYKRHPEALFAVVEPDTVLFRQALSCRDYSDLIRSGRMNLLLGSPPEGVIALLDTVKSTRIQSCLLRSVYGAHKEFYDRLDKIVREYIAKREINTNTHNRFNRLWINNISRNAGLLGKAAGVAHLQEKFAGLPALMLAAGPGLSRLLPLLPRLRERVLLVCVDTALKACLREGIEPDFTVLTDPQYWNTRHLDRCRLEKSILVSDVSTYPTVFRMNKGPLFFCSTPFPLGQYLEKRTEIKGKLKSGGSVATTAWDLIRTMGCRPIYCAGLDLSFPGKQTHYRGSTFEETVHCVCHRFQPGEKAGWQYLYNGNPYRVKDYAGRPLLTDQRMKVYISWFEKQMAEHPEAQTYNLSDRGIPLEGMPVEDPEHLLALPERRQELDGILEESAAIGPGFQREQLARAVGDLTREMEQLVTLTSQGLAHSRKMEREGIDPVLLEELERIDQEILTMGGREIAGFFLLPLLEGFLAGAAKKRTPQEILQRSGEFYSALKESLDFHLSELELLKNGNFS